MDVQDAASGRLPDGLDVHRLGVPQSLPGRKGRGQERGVAAVGLAVSRVGGVRVRRVHVAVVQEERGVGLRGIHTLHGGVHLVDQLLQIHVVICGRTKASERGAGLQGCRCPLGGVSMSVCYNRM